MELEFLKGQTKQWVPILNGTLLHSSVDPVKEARQLVDVEWRGLEEVQSIIVFGLGGGFHIQEILNRRTNSVSIVVIESSRELVMAMNEKNPELMSKIDCLATVPAAQIYREPAIRNSLSRSYAIFKHPASLRAAPYYYGPVQDVLSSRSVEILSELVGGNAQLSRFIKSLNISHKEMLTLPLVEEALVKRGSGIETEGLIWMALRELIL